MLHALTDPWLDAARALKTTAQAHPAVIRLAANERYETRGRGGAVRGVGLRSTGDAVEAVLGLVLDEAAATAHGLPPLIDQVRAALLTQWQAMEPTVALQIRLDVLDIAPRAAPPAPTNAPPAPSEPSDASR